MKGKDAVMKKLIIMFSLVFALLIPISIYALDNDIENMSIEELREAYYELQTENEELKEQIKVLQGEKSEVDENKDAIHITKDSEFPIVVYDGELGTYQINSMTYYSNPSSSPYYETGYVFELEFSNMYDKAVNTSLGHCYLNDYKCSVYYDVLEVASGKKAVTTCYIRDEEITDAMKDFSIIECDYIVFEEGDYYSQSTDIYTCPLIIDRDAITIQ